MSCTCLELAYCKSDNNVGCWISENRCCLRHRPIVSKCDATAGNPDWYWYWDNGNYDVAGWPGTEEYRWLSHLLSPLSHQKVLVVLGGQLLTFRKGTTEISRGIKGGDQIPAIGETVSSPPYQQSPSPTASSSQSQPATGSLFVVSNEPTSGPCGPSRSRPVIKMKCAADPTVPFRKEEHWPQDLYLIDPPGSERKKFTSSREACPSLHCSISEQMSL